MNEKITIECLAGNNFCIEIGSTLTRLTWNKDELIEKIKDVLFFNLFDKNFYLNYTDKKIEYLKIFKNNVLQPLLLSIDDTLDNFFEFKTTQYNYNKYILLFKHKEPQYLIDDFFVNNCEISKELKKDYYNYRKNYSNVIL